MNIVSLDRIKRVPINSGILTLLAGFVIFSLVFQHRDKVDLRPFWDETYHITDDLAEGRLKSINPLDPEYDFMGHPPGYPLTVLAWFKVFPKNFQSARYHALTFSFLTLFAFFWFCWINTNWVLAIAATYAIAGSPTFLYNIHRTIADIPSLTFLFLTLISIQKRSFFLAGLCCLIYCLIRESGLALVGAIFLAQVVVSFLKMRVLSWKKLVMVTAPSVIGLGCFYLICKYVTGTTLLHPNAANSLSFYSNLLSWIPEKEKTMQTLLRIVQNNSPIPTVLVTFFLGVAFALRKKIQLTAAATLSHLSFFFTAAGFLIFFTLYNDSLGRDVFPTIFAFVYLPVFLAHKLGRGYSLLILTTIFLMTSFQSMHPSEKHEIDLLGEVAHVIESEYMGRRICIQSPLPHVKQSRIHGYFRSQKPFSYDCTVPEVLIFKSHGAAIPEDKTTQLIEKNNMALRKTLKSVHHNTNYKIYVRQ